MKALNSLKQLAVLTAPLPLLEGTGAENLGSAFSVHGTNLYYHPWYHGQNYRLGMGFVFCVFN